MPADPQSAHHTCLCRLCLRDRQIAMVRNYGRQSDMRRLIDELHDAVECAEFDNDYWEAIRAGDWPSAREIAKDIISLCDAKEKAA